MPRKKSGPKRKFQSGQSYSKKRKIAQDLAKKINKLANVDSPLIHQTRYSFRNSTIESSNTLKLSLLNQNTNKKIHNISSKKSRF